MATSLFVRKGASKDLVYLSCRVYYRIGGKVAVNLTTATKLSVNRQEWENAHDGTAKHLKEWLTTDEGKRINKAELEIRKQVDAYIDNGGRAADRIKRIVENVVTPANESKVTTLCEFCDKYVQDCKEGLVLSASGHNKGERKSDSTLSLYDTITRFLHDYEQARDVTVHFDDVTSERLADIRFFMTERNFKTNSINIYTRVLRTMLKVAEKKGLLDLRKIDVPSIGYAPADTVYLSQERLDILWCMDFGTRLNKVRDVFLLGCETAQRYSDYSRLTLNDVVTEMDGTQLVHVVQQKTGAEVYLPLTPRAKTILERMDGKVRSKTYVNDEIKNICRMAGFTELVEVTSSYGLERKKQHVPFCELVSTHTARRTAATLMYKAGCPLAEIQAVTGHKTESSLRNYLRLTALEKGMAAARSRYFKEKMAAV